MACIQIPIALLSGQANEAILYAFPGCMVNDPKSWVTLGDVAKVVVFEAGPESSANLKMPGAV